MRISLSIVHDSWNSYPTDDLEFTIDEKHITFNIKGEKERSITILRDEFIEFAKILIPHDARNTILT